MKDRTKFFIIGATVAASAAVPAIASAGGSNDDGGAADSSDAREVDVPITGTDLEKATAAALAHVGEGRITGTEVGDEESYYEIEITLDDGRQLDVQLDKQFNFVGSEDEGSGSDD
ncbi:MAG TPA: hypothetical protein VI980_09025 [Acidimicrobiia bacterium]|nr:hypothetical protein [Acidimicrobiia bacterium]